MKRIVLSGVNMVEGGLLSIFREFIRMFSMADNVELICLVHSVNLFDKKYLTRNNIKLIEFPEIKRSWFRRIKFEYYDCYQLSKELKADIWLSLHDMTPNVITPKQYVYCHNSSPFYRATKTDFRYDKKFWLFTLLYKFLYGINIKKNEAVIVQQTWMANKFEEWFGIKSFIVAKPIPENIIDDNSSINTGVYVKKSSMDKLTLLYPAFPRTFKNFEVIIDAIELLNQKNFSDNIELRLTFDGTTNKYARHIIDKCKRKNINNIRFLGILSREEIDMFYMSSDVIIFPSKLESWGLPITEAKSFNKPILLANLSYAHETIGSYNQVKFFDPNNYKELSDILMSIIQEKYVFEKVLFQKNTIKYKMSHSWNELLILLIQ